eukprot:Skav223785  [mRNA]  locus=scaffold575:275931:285484:- [translate_table: standard]
MKKSSVKTAPKGRTPPTKMVKDGLINHDCTGICRGIWFVLTGSSMLAFLKPKKAPKQTKGTDTPNHRHNIANIVVKGTAPEDLWPQISKFRTKKIPKKIPGYRKAVSKVICFQSVP